MEVNTRPRKACDLCYTRKLKCDGQSPHCSNCVIYAADCTHATPSRKWKPRAQRNGRTKETDDIQSLKAQVQRLKDQLAQRPARELSPDSRDNASSSMSLPPLQQAMPVVGAFLNRFNSVLPLFHADTLLRLVGECYSLPPQKRDPVIWAAINVVLALGSQQMPPARPRTRRDHATEYLNRAQSVISTVILGELRLINIQTLVGMAMVLQSAHDSTPSLILISATMRLAHKMGLHSRTASAHLDPAESRQRARVFWLAYMLDKDLSLRARQPSVQLDDDIDLDLPSLLQRSDEEEDEDDTAGIVVTADGSAGMDYFLARVQLANIQGGVYDFLYSTRASKRSPEERSTARENLVAALARYRASIPPEFNPTAVASSTSNNPSHVGFFCLLHAATLQCMTLINRAHAWDKQWVGGLRDHGRGTRALQLPPEWGALVSQARDYMILFGEAWSSDAWFRWWVPPEHDGGLGFAANIDGDNVRMASCPYTSAMVLLTANNLHDPHHDAIQLDCRLVDAALLWLDDMSSVVQTEEVRTLRTVCTEAVREVRRKRSEGIAATRGGVLFSKFLSAT